MSTDKLPHRCPKCNALVVDRRSPVCTTCRAELPKDWVMTTEQIAKLKKIDAASKAAHIDEMHKIDPLSDPNIPAWVRFLEQPVRGNQYPGL